MSTPKTRSLLYLLCSFLLSITACEKDKPAPQPRKIQLVTPKSALVGRWKLVEWISLSYNAVDCENFFQTTFHADIQGVNFEFEVGADGSVRNYKNDTLVKTFFLTGVSSAGSFVTEYNINDGQQLLRAVDVPSSFDIGDTLKGSNPVLDLDTYTGSNIWRMTGVQRYIKVE